MRRALIATIALAACTKGPSVPQNTALDRNTHDPKFPIATGVHANADCNDCHGTFSTFTEFSCTAASCHPQSKTDPAHSGLAGYSFDDHACLGCHPRGDVPAFDHTFFPIGTATSHATETCSDCHPTGDHSQFSCTSSACHAQAKMDPAHTGIAGYAFADASCLQCHPKGVVPPFDHTFFPIGTGTHHPTESCADCHPTGDHTQFTCTSSACHAQPKMDPAHSGIAGYAFADASCLQCHPKGDVPPFDHSFFPIGTGTTHPTESCADCHPTGDHTQFTCTSSACHAQPKTNLAHTGLAGYAFTDAACLQCHPQGLVPAFDHTFFPIGTGTTHPTESCADCHPTGDHTQFTCTSSACHAQTKTDLAHSGLPNYSFADAACLQCHPQGQVPPFDHSGFFPIGGTTHHVDQTCANCHPTGDHTQFTCLTCHEHAQPLMDGDHQGIAGYAYDSAQCLSCHPKGDVGPFDHVKFFPIAQGDKHQPVGCADCHTDPTQRSVTTCNLCHSHPIPDIGALHGAVHDYDGATSMCLRCHADSQVSPVAAHLPFRIDAQTAHRSTGCLQCHPKFRTDKPYGADFVAAAVDCLACHNQSEMNDTHQGMAGYSYQSLSCIQGGCHADGTKPGD